VAIAATGRRADRDEHRLGTANRGSKIGGEGEPAGSDVFRHHLVQARLIDRHVAFVQGGQLVGIDLDHCDFGAELGEAGAGDQADIAAADHRNTHVCDSLR
jgi:hypothetical protein